jgi:hypothetical protein
MKNRYGTEYSFVECEPGVYKIVGDFHYWRFAAAEEPNTLLFADPEGGPFIEVGNYQIKGNTVTKIYIDDHNQLCFQTTKT